MGNRADGMLTRPRQVPMRDELWEALKDRAKAEGKTASQAVRDLVVEYTESPPEWGEPIGRQ